MPIKFWHDDIIEEYDSSHSVTPGGHLQVNPPVIVIMIETMLYSLPDRP